jgi:hypothetical protein
MKDKRSSYEAIARNVAEHILGSAPEPFAPKRMSKYAHWFTDPQDTCVIAVVMPGEKPTAGDEVLAYGLAWQHNRDLHLVLPEDMIAEALTRKAWIDTEVRIWHYDGDGTPRAVPSVGRFQLFSHLSDLPPRKSKAAVLTNEHESWLAGIETEGLTRHARSYVSWHCEGLQVLKVTKSKGGLRIQAGVQYSGVKRPEGREPFNKVFSNAPTPAELAVINAKVQLAIEDGGSQTSQMSEHKMQATLIDQPDVLGLTKLWREFPAWRGLRTSSFSPSGRPGYIDFLGADADGVLHVVETKIGHDPKVVLQALDYAIWVKANDEAIRETLKTQGHVLPKPRSTMETAGSPAPIHLVLGATEKDKAFNSYLAGQIEALAGDVRIKVYLTAEPTAQPLDLTEVPKRRLWTASELVSAPVTGPRWAESVTAALLDRP